MARDTYQVLRTSDDDMRNTMWARCCAYCEYCDIELLPWERQRYRLVGTQAWRTKEGTPVKRSTDAGRLICTYYNTPTVADEDCPMYRRDKQIWK